MQTYAFMSPDKLATLLPALLSSKGFSPGRETAARAVAISSMLKISVPLNQYAWTLAVDRKFAYKQGWAARSPYSRQ
jgi:hypothetical protein